MIDDFKQNYINEQRELDKARKQRLAKLGMISDESETEEKSESAERQPAPARPARPEQPRQPQNAQQRMMPRNGTRPTQPQRPASRPGITHPVTAQQTSSNRTDTVNRQPQRPSASAARPPMNGGQMRPQGQNRMNTEPVPQTRRTPKPASGQVRSNSDLNANNVSRSGNYAKRPELERTAVYTGRNGNARTKTYPAQRPANRNEADDIFNGISDNKSREYMFALTGRAEVPSDGGNVDVVDVGRGDRKKGASPVSKAIKKKKKGAKTYIGRSVAVFFTLILFLVASLYSTLLVIAHGPSPSVRDQLVLMASQASATKWVPYLVLDKGTVGGIIDKSHEVRTNSISIDDYTDAISDDEKGDGKDGDGTKTDKWENAVNGVILETVNGSTYKAYVLLVKDPSRVFVGTSTDDFKNATAGVDVFAAADRYNALACINGGEFLDNGGHGSGYAPLGLTYSEGKCVFNDYSTKTFMGFTKDNKLVVRESMTQDEADRLGIRDAVSFQNNNTLLEYNDESKTVTAYYEDGNTGTSQRSAIGQAADGTVILIVTDGRTASCPGATHNDMIDLMVQYGAISAGMLDGGSSAMMYYRNYYNVLPGYDTEKMDEYQLRGLVNNYKAFTNPRKIPSFFMVKP